MRATEVLPVPRDPANRYACDNLSCATACSSVALPRCMAAPVKSRAATVVAPVWPPTGIALAALLLLDNADTTATGTTIVTDAIAITNSGGSNFTKFLNTPTLDISAAGAITGATGITSSGSITFSGLTANSFLYSGTGGLLTTTTAPTNGQLLIGSTGVAPVAAALTQGSGITVTNGAGSITIASTLGTAIDTTEITDNTITGTDIADDNLDFIDFEDTLDLDAALTLNQTTNTWSQTFTGTTTTGFSYTANSLTSGTGIEIGRAHV